MNFNPKDPLRKNGPDQQKLLFDRFTKEANGFSTEEVIGAAVNLVLNALRQAHGTRRSAETRFDELNARTRGCCSTITTPSLADAEVSSRSIRSSGWIRSWIGIGTDPWPG